MSRAEHPLPTEGMDSLGARLRWLIEERLNQKQAPFARRIGATPPMVSRWVGNARKPSESYLDRIVEETGVSAAWLLLGVGQPFEGESDSEPGDEPTEDAADGILRVLMRTIRAVGGWETIPEADRPRLLTVILLDEIDDWEEAGRDTRPLRELIRKVSRGEFE